MPVDFINISSIWPTDGNPLGVNGDLNIVGVSPRYLVNGNPMGMVSTISPGNLSGAVTLSAGANMSITQTGQTITFASTGGGSGGTSQWIDVVGPGGGIYYGGHVGIKMTDPEATLDVNGGAFFRGGDDVLSGVGTQIFYHPILQMGVIQTYDYTAQLRVPLWVIGNPLILNPWDNNVGIGTANPSMGSLQIARSDGGYQLVLERSGPNDPQLYGIGISGTPGAPTLALQDITHGWATRMAITPSGNVGIGTAGPQALLHLVASSTLFDPSVTYNSPAAWILNTANAELAAGLITTPPWTYWVQARAGGNVAHPLALNPAGGNVGIGVTNPQCSLDSIGLVRIQGLGNVPTTGAGIEMYYTSGGTIQAWDRDGGAPAPLQFYASQVAICPAPFLANVGIGIGNPGYRFHVVGGRAVFQQSAEPYCIGIGGSATANLMYLGTDAWANLGIYDGAGGTRFMFTQAGTCVISNGAPFDPGNPRLQVAGGLCINNMADNGYATIRMVSADQAWGCFWHYPNQTLSFGVTNPWDAYGWAAAWPMSIDCGTGVVNIATLSSVNITATGNIQCNGTVNAAAFTVNGQPLQSGMGNGWTQFACDVRNSTTNTPLALNWGYAWYNVQGNLIFISIMYSLAENSSLNCHIYTPMNLFGTDQLLTTFGLNTAQTGPASNPATVTAGNRLGWVMTPFTGVAGTTYIISGAYRIA